MENLQTIAGTSMVAVPETAVHSVTVTEVRNVLGKDGKTVYTMAMFVSKDELPSSSSSTPQGIAFMRMSPNSFDRNIKSFQFVNQEFLDLAGIGTSRGAMKIVVPNVKLTVIETAVDDTEENRAKLAKEGTLVNELSKDANGIPVLTGKVRCTPEGQLIRRFIGLQNEGFVNNVFLPYIWK